MSETDSDLDFQDAEDTEFDRSLKYKNTPLCFSPKKPVDVNIENKETVNEKKHNEAAEILIEEIDASLNTTNNYTESFKAQLSSDIKQIDNSEKENESENTAEEKDLLTTQFDNTTFTASDRDKRKSEEISLCNSIENNTAKSSTNRYESHREKERVILRREKKLHEKQQSSQQAVVEREKASDLINLLEDPYKDQQSSWGFSSWGSSLLSSAASSVSTFSNHVSQGIGTVFETVENSLGAPEPEELARTLNERKKEENTSETIDESTSDAKLNLLPDVSLWTKVLENTGSKVIAGSLGTLEFIGKKTMDILTEGDPGLRKKRTALSGRVDLSEILREIKAKADKEDSQNDSDSIHYSQIFDEKQGLVHLEALEMLSKQSQAKFQRLLLRHSKNVEVRKQLEEIKSICENVPSVDDLSDCDNFEDFETVFKKHALELNLPLNVDSILKTTRQIEESVGKFESAPAESQIAPKEIFQSGICSLAEFTAKSIETFHKITELIMVQKNFNQDLEHCATNLTGLTTVMCIEINNLSTRYHKCLDAAAEHVKDQVTSEHFSATALATNLYMEASNSNNYIQDAYQMLIPVLQVCVLEALD